MSLDLVKDWLAENAREAILGNGKELSISGIAPYQPFDGLMEFKVVNIVIILFLLIYCLVFVSMLSLSVLSVKFSYYLFPLLFEVSFKHQMLHMMLVRF